MVGAHNIAGLAPILPVIQCLEYTPYALGGLVHGISYISFALSWFSVRDDWFMPPSSVTLLIPYQYLEIRRSWEYPTLGLT